MNLSKFIKKNIKDIKKNNNLKIKIINLNLFININSLGEILVKYKNKIINPPIIIKKKINEYQKELKNILILINKKII